MANTLTSLAEGYAPDKGMNMAPYLPNLPMHPSLAGAPASGAATMSPFGSFRILPNGRYFVPQNEDGQGGWDDYAFVNADRTGGYKAYGQPGDPGTPYTFDNTGGILPEYGRQPWAPSSGFRGLLDSVKQGQGQQEWGPTRGTVYNTAPEERAFTIGPEETFMQAISGGSNSELGILTPSPLAAFTAGFGGVAAGMGAAAGGMATTASLEASAAAGQAGAVGAGGVLGSAGTAATVAPAFNLFNPSTWSNPFSNTGSGMNYGDIIEQTGNFTGGETPWGANSGGGMEWFDEALRNFNPDLGFQGLNEAGSGLTGGMGSGLGTETFVDNWDMLKDPFNTYQIPQLIQNYGGATGLLNTLTEKIGSQAAKSLLGKVLSGEGSASDYAQLLGQLGATGLGIYGANQQSTALSDLAKRYEGYGAPYRARLAESYADPNAFLANSPDIQASVNQGTNALARSLSTQGNPTGSGRALQELQNYATQGLYGQLGNERNRLANFGGMSSFNAASPGLAGQAIGAQGGVLNALGSGISSITNPPTTLEQALNAINGMQGLKINTGFSL